MVCNRCFTLKTSFLYKSSSGTIGNIPKPTIFVKNPFNYQLRIKTIHYNFSLKASLNMSMINKVTAELKGDRVIWAVVAVLAMISILTIYSSSSSLAFRNNSGNTEYYLIKQVITLGIGLLIIYVFHLFHYKRFNVWAPYMLVLTIPLLALTLAVGTEVNDAQRWLEVPGLGLTFQTSDLAKISLITYIARSITAKQDYISDFQSAFLPIIMPIILVCLLIAPSNLSTALVIFATCTVIMFIGRVAMKYIFLLFFCGLVAFSGLIVVGQAFPDKVRVNTWTSRLRNFVTESEDADQTKVAKMAIATGGITGAGPGNSLQKNFLPNAFSDYLYAVIIEEYGFDRRCFCTGFIHVAIFEGCSTRYQIPQDFSRHADDGANAYARRASVSQHGSECASGTRYGFATTHAFDGWDLAAI